MTITVYNFEEFIPSDLLDRGRSCFNNGSIRDIEQFNRTDIVAIVEGTDTYNVNFSLNQDMEILTHACNCPYTSGPICKHKVAVLLLIRDNQKKGIAINEGSLTTIKNELESYKKEEIIQILTNLAKSNVKTRNQILFQLGLKT